MKALVLGLNYAPEPVGIGIYTTGTAEALAAAGHEVRVVAGKPYYPNWRVDPAYARPLYPTQERGGVWVTRCPHYVPAKPTGTRRLVHHATFAATAAPVVWSLARKWRPDLVFAVAPSLATAPLARRAARIAGAQLWLHVQDFEVEAAVVTGLLDGGGWIARGARRFEDAALKGADRVTSIGPAMVERLHAKGVPPERTGEFRNWAEVGRIGRLDRPSRFRERWGLEGRKVVLYSGNIAHKQGLGTVVEMARHVAGRPDVTVVICGNGPNRDALASASADLPNLRLYDLQPADELGELLGLADVHLLPQIAGAADLMLPSKMVNMMASCRPVAATAAPHTSIARELEGCGLVTPPGDAAALARSVERLIDDPALAASLADTARARVEESWARDAILARMVEDAELLVGSR